MFVLLIFLSDLKRPAPITVIFVQKWPCNFAVRVAKLIIISLRLLFSYKAGLYAVSVEKPEDKTYQAQTHHYDRELVKHQHEGASVVLVPRVRRALDLSYPVLV